VTGRGALLCALHKEQCVRAGGFAKSIGTTLEMSELPIAEFRQQLRHACVAELPTVSQNELQGALRKVAPDVLLTVLLQALQSSTHATASEMREIEEAPSLPRRRPRSASPEQGKRD
jgi:hypothetical protein